MLTPDQKGSIAEMAVAWTAVKRGIGVFKPLTDGERYDLIFDLRPTLARVQCKWSVRRGEVVVINCRSCRRGPDGFIHRRYSTEEVDLVAAYCADTERCYVVPPGLFDRRAAVQLRLSPTRNNQLVGVNWARDFEFERLDWDALGAVAQLGERRAGSA